MTMTDRTQTAESGGNEKNSSEKAVQRLCVDTLADAWQQQGRGTASDYVARMREHLHLPDAPEVDVNRKMLDEIFESEKSRFGAKLGKERMETAKRNLGCE